MSLDASGASGSTIACWTVGSKRTCVVVADNRGNWSRVTLMFYIAKIVR